MRRIGQGCFGVLSSGRLGMVQHRINEITQASTSWSIPGLKHDQRQGREARAFGAEKR